MDFDDFSTIYLIFQSKCPFSMVKVSLSGNTIIIPVITCDEGIECYSTRMEMFDFDDNCCQYPLWVLALKLTLFQACSLQMCIN